MAAFMERAAKIIDLKKPPPKFGGDAADWPEFRYRFEDLMGRVGVGLKEALETAATVELNMLDQLSEAGREVSRFVHAMLLDCCTSEAHRVVRQARDQNGLKAWRKFLDDYQPRRAYRYTEWFSKLLVPHWVAGKPFLPQMRQWEAEIQDYQEETGKRIDSETKCSVVALHAPEVVRRYLQESDRDLTQDFEMLKRALEEHHSKVQTYGGRGKSVIELDEVKGKGKGKQKEKGKEDSRVTIKQRRIKVPERKEEKVQERALENQPAKEEKAVSQRNTWPKDR